MKAITTILLLLFLFSNKIFCQFELCNTPTNNKLNDIYFIDENIGIVVGDNGTILRSIDGGDNWQIVNTTIDENLKKVRFFDNTNGIIIGWTKILTTNDAGLTWVESMHDNTLIYDIKIIDSTTCVISCFPSTLIQSTTKGTTFTTIADTPNVHFTSISFLNDRIAYLCKDCSGGPSNIYKTADGGMTWQYIASDGNTIIEGFEFINEDTGFKGGWYNGHLKKTNNMGMHWDIINSEWNINDFHIKPTMPNSFYTCGYHGLIGKSIDRGDNWFKVNSNTDKSLFGIFFYNDNLGWVVGQDGIILKTTNGSQITNTQELLKENKIVKIFPNPAKGILEIDTQNDILEILIYDVQGTFIDSYKNTKTINVINYKNGIYIVFIKTKKSIFVRKLVKN